MNSVERRQLKKRMELFKDTRMRNLADVSQPRFLGEVKMLPRSGDEQLTSANQVSDQTIEVCVFEAVK